MTWLGEEFGFLEVEPHDPRKRRSDREVVLLLHGIGGSKDDWRFPVARGWHFDVSRSPPDHHDDNHWTWPPLLWDVTMLWPPTRPLSPKRTDVRCWTGVLRALGHTVINYSQDGPEDTVDVPRRQLEELIVPFVRNDVLTGELAGKRVVVLCHSRGGILARAYLHRNTDDASAWISRVITLCSPHQGTLAPNAKEKLANTAAVIGSQTPLGITPVLVDLGVQLLTDWLGEGAGRNQLLPGDPMFAELATPADVPNIEFRTFGGTSVRYSKIYAYFYTPASFVPNIFDFPDVRFDWTSVAVELEPVSPLLDQLPDALVDEEQDNGKGDGLVADSKARMVGAPHESFPINHVEALYDERLFARVADLLGTPLSGAGHVHCGRPVDGLSVEPSVVSFGSVKVGETATRMVRIQNDSRDRVTVQLAASPPGVFEWAAVNTEFPGGEGVTVTFRFSPGDNTIRTERVRITNTANNSPHEISLVGKGGIGGFPTPPPDEPLPTRLTYSTTHLVFGSVEVDNEATRELRIGNPTGRTVRVQIARSAHGAVFQWPAVDASIAYGTEREVTVTFRPTEKVFSNGELVVQSDTPISPETILLSGKGGIGGFPTPQSD